MKAVANRPKDREDIRGLLAAHPDADIAEVRRWVREFATATGMPDMLKELEELLAATIAARAPFRALVGRLGHGSRR
jgi:hypothetical protein